MNNTKTRNFLIKVATAFCALICIFGAIFALASCKKASGSERSLTITADAATAIEDMTDEELIYFNYAKRVTAETNGVNSGYNSVDYAQKYNGGSMRVDIYLLGGSQVSGCNAPYQCYSVRCGSSYWYFFFAIFFEGWSERTINGNYLTANAQFSLTGSNYSPATVSGEYLSDVDVMVFLLRSKVIYDDSSFNLHSDYGNVLYVEYGATLPLPDDPEKEGYTFTGWYLDEACTVRYNKNYITEDTVLYAGWTPNQYSITYDFNGGGYISVGDCSYPEKGFYGSAIGRMSDAERYGYTFLGWYTPDGEKVESTTIIYSDMLLRAEWEINTYTYTLYGNGGTFSETNDETWIKEWTVETGRPEKPKPTRTGYTFAGWYFDEACTNYFDENSAMYVYYYNQVLYAGWRINTYTVRLSPNGGELDVLEVYGEYNTVPELPIPSRTGYNFVGWTLLGEGYDVETPLTADINLVAQWKVIMFTVTFIVDGETYTTLSVPYGTTLVDAVKLQQKSLKSQNLTASYYITASGESVVGSYKVSEDVSVYAEKMNVFQWIQAHWVWSIIIGVAAIALITFICCIPVIVKHVKNKKRIRRAPTRRKTQKNRRR